MKGFETILHLLLVVTPAAYNISKQQIHQWTITAVTNQVFDFFFFRRSMIILVRRTVCACVIWTNAWFPWRDMNLLFVCLQIWVDYLHRKGWNRKNASICMVRHGKTNSIAHHHGTKSFIIFTKQHAYTNPKTKNKKYNYTNKAIDHWRVSTQIQMSQQVTSVLLVGELKWNEMK